MRLNFIRFIGLWLGITGACMVLGADDEPWMQLGVYFALCLVITVSSLDRHDR